MHFWMNISFLWKIYFQTIQNYTEHIWRLTNQYNVLQPEEWKDRVSDVMLDYQLEVIDNVRSGYVGNLPGKYLCYSCEFLGINVS